MSQSRGDKIRALHTKSPEESNVFWMSLEEAKLAISDKYEFLADRYEKRDKPKILKQKQI